MNTLSLKLDDNSECACYFVLPPHEPTTEFFVWFLVLFSCGDKLHYGDKIVEG